MCAVNLNLRGDFFSSLFVPGLPAMQLEAAVAISESSNGEAPNAFISHVAAVSWAATQTPETALGNHTPTKAGFLSAKQIEGLCFGSLATCNR
jgi:hypothetical protein